jgi:transposase InsO family protein
VQRLKGSKKAKQRAEVLLRLMFGEYRVPKACAELGIGEARLDQLRYEAFQPLVTALEEKLVGRPARTPSPAELENEQLRARIERLEAELEVAQVRIELGVALPRVGAASKKNDSATPALSLPNHDAAPPAGVATEEAIVNHLKNLMPSEPVAEGPARRGFAGQRADRDNDQVVRRHAVDTAQRLVDRGLTRAQAAALLRIPERTLSDWRLAWETDRLRAVPLGRPAYLAPRSVRNVVIQRIDKFGPGVGLPTLRAEFPNLPRIEIEDILKRFRRVYRRRFREQLNELHWFKPGAVWAIDHHGPRAQAIDGRCHYLLAVRDLASGQVLLWLPVTDATAHTTVEAIEALFIVHGAPLVLKSDNGSAFIADPLRQLCQKFAVKNLYSPPRTPSYNGSIEATIGSLKTWTEDHAAQAGHPGIWSTADTEAARHAANTLARPHGRSPDQVWTARPTIAQGQRDTFFDAASRRFEDIAAQGSPENDAQHRATDRAAISQVLVELGYLSITRGRFRLPVCKKKMAEMR